MKRIALIAMAMAAAGCQSKPIEQMSYTELNQLSGEIVKRCYAQGVKPRTREMQICTQQEITREQATRAANTQRRIAFGQAMSNMGDQMQQNARNQAVINSMNRPINCTSTPGMNGVVRTNCY